MVEDAKNTLIELGLYDAISRRYAALSDVSINDVLYADRSVQPRLKNADVFDALKTQVGGTASPKTFDRVDTVSMETFLSDVLPLADTIEVFLENKHEKNLVSLVTAANKDATHLFKWENPFSLVLQWGPGRLPYPGSRRRQGRERHRGSLLPSGVEQLRRPGFAHDGETREVRRIQDFLQESGAFFAE